MMKKIKKPLDTLPMFYIPGFGVPFCIFGFFGILMEAVPFFINGVVWLTLGAGVKLKSFWNKGRLTYLKASGIGIFGLCSTLILRIPADIRWNDIMWMNNR